MAMSAALAINPEYPLIASIDHLNSANNRTYDYDGQGRLTHARGDWGAVAYQYDSVGNLRRKQFGFFVVDINYNNLNQVENSVNPATGTRNYVHDNRGNVRWRGHLRFGYSGAQRPTSLMSDENGTLKSIGAYRYDGHGRRVKSITKTDEGDITRYNIFDASGALVWVVQLHPDGGDENHVTNYVGMDTGSGPGASGQTIARVKSVGTRINYVDEVTYLHNDHLGSAVAGTDASGAIVFKERYLPFGGTQVNNAANENQAGFTGHIKDTDTGLNYMQARYYDPEIGRFLSIDPVTFMDTQNPAHFNRYAYANNDPVNMIDQFGLCATDADGNQTGLCGGNEGGTALVEQQLGNENSIASEIDSTAQAAGERVEVNTVDASNAGATKNEITVATGATQTVEHDNGIIESIAAPVDEVFEHEGQHNLEKLTGTKPEGTEIGSSGYPTDKPHAVTAIGRANQYRKAEGRGYQRFCSTCSVLDAVKHKNGQ